MSTHQAYLGLGSNEAEPLHQIKQAVSILSENKSLKIIGYSSLYYSKPVDASIQADFLNCVVEIETLLSPHELLKLCKSIEQHQKRIYYYHWGPRTIDIDILSYDQLKLKTKQLTIPHPEIQNRDFVTIPLLELDANLALPNIGLISKLAPPTNIYKQVFIPLINAETTSLSN